MQFLCPSATCAPPGGARIERLSPWGKQKLYAASAHARDRRLGGQAKRSWAVKSRVCCEPSDACLLRVGVPRQQAPNRSHSGASLLIVGGSGDWLRSVS